MASFIVISLQERLNWLIDGILESRPHNLEVDTYISFGKIIEEKGEVRSYEYTSHIHHEDKKSGYTTTSKKRDSDYLRNMFNNQIAQFLNVSGNEGQQINIFLLDNPITSLDYQNSKMIIEELIAVYTAQFITNFQIIRVLFSYDLIKPQDMNRHVDCDVLKEILDSPFKAEFPYRILLIDNQNIHGAATSVSDEAHNLMLPRMLCDFMMLMSNINDAYNTASFIKGKSNIFSLGYAEAMYYHTDVFTFYKMANKKALLELLLNAKNDDVSLDYKKYPFGLANRIEEHKELMDIPFNVDIKDYPESIDYKINEKIKTFQTVISKYFESFSNIKNMESIVEIPEYIDRETIYEKFLIDNNSLELNVEKYNELLNIINSLEFRTFISNHKEDQIENVHSNENHSQLSERSGCNIFRWFRLKLHPYDIVHDKHELNKTSIEDLVSLEKYIKDKEKYRLLLIKVEKIKQEINLLTEAINDLTATNHAKSVWNFVDMSKLKEYHSRTTDFEYLISKWNSLHDENRTIDYLLGTLLDEKTKYDLWNKYYVDWKEPLDFLNMGNLKNIVYGLLKISSPFARIYNTRSEQPNLITFGIYSDNPRWIDLIKEKEFDLPEKDKISIIHSTHTCSKICMFQFLQMDDESVSGIVRSNHIPYIPDLN